MAEILISVDGIKKLKTWLAINEESIYELELRGNPAYLLRKCWVSCLNPAYVLGFAAKLPNSFTDLLFKHSSPSLISDNSFFAHSIGFVVLDQKKPLRLQD